VSHHSSQIGRQMPKPRRQRIHEFREFIIKNFEIKGRLVLDVAGGKGDLSWLLCNIDGANSVVVDPRCTDHSKLEREALWYYQHRNESILGKQSPLMDLQVQPPYLAARHLRIFMDDKLLDSLNNTEKTDLDWEKFWKEANERSENLPEMLHHQPRSKTDAAAACATEASTIKNPIDGRNIIESTTLILGFHPDEGTEPCINLALKLKIPFAVVPCCVFPNLFNNRKLPNGRQVRSYNEFILYLKLKNKNMRETKLIFFDNVSSKSDAPDAGDSGSRGYDTNHLIEPRSTVLWMKQSDFEETDEYVYTNENYEDKEKTIDIPVLTSVVCMKRDRDWDNN
jgi:hypothetical protein